MGSSAAPAVLTPFDRREAVDLQAAAQIAGVSASTMRGWCASRHIGRRVAGGPWRVSRPALQMLLDADDDALSAYLAGERSGLVAPYFARIGLSIAP